MSHQKPIVAVIAPLPPPVTGMTAVTRDIANRLYGVADVREWSCSGGNLPPGIGKALLRLYRYAAAVVMLARLRLAGARQLYSVANSAGGLWFDLVLLRAASLLGYRITLHHHVYAYVRRLDRRMQRIDRVIAKRGAHVFLCEAMRRDFAKQYSSTAESRAVHNPLVIEAGREPRQPWQGDRPLRLGHLSNLTPEKGLGEVIATMQELRRRGEDVTLEIAGPAKTPEAQQMIAAAQADAPEAFTHCGPVYGEAKQAYFDRIDVMLFPTRYKNEAQPLVVLEALAAGAPTLSLARGCLRSMGEAPALCVYDADAGFVPLAADQIQQWIADPAAYAAASESARQQAETWSARSEQELSGLVAWVAGAASPQPVATPAAASVGAGQS